jgi:hypothetical protein
LCRAVKHLRGNRGRWSAGQRAVRCHPGIGFFRHCV